MKRRLKEKDALVGVVVVVRVVHKGTEEVRLRIKIFNACRRKGKFSFDNVTKSLQVDF